MTQGEGGCVVTIVPIAPRTSFSDDLRIADTSLCIQTFLLFIGVISISASRVLRDQLAGDPCAKAIPILAVLRTKTFAGIISFLAFVYFVFEAQYIFQKSDTLAGCLSAKAELIASLLVLISAALKLYSLNILSCREVSTPEEIEIGELPVI